MRRNSRALRAFRACTSFISGNYIIFLSFLCVYICVASIAYLNRDIDAAQKDIDQPYDYRSANLERKVSMKDHLSRGAAKSAGITCLNVYAFNGSPELTMVKCALDMLEKSNANDIVIQTYFNKSKRKFAQTVSRLRPQTTGFPPAYIPEQSEGVLLLLGCSDEKPTYLGGLDELLATGSSAWGLPAEHDLIECPE